MARPHRIEELEKEFGEKPDTLIPRVVNEKSSQKAAARELNVAESTVSLWLRQNGYVAKKQWVKDGQTLCNKHGAN
jgi:hypothetical protein